MARAEVRRGRWTAHVEGDFVVFLIGLRVNKPWVLHRWLPVTREMVPMLRELMADEESGLLGFRTLVGLRGPTMVQYWRSMEHLERFANDPGRTHRLAWRRFFERSWRGEAVGIWHETYVVPAGSYESIYGNMPPTGLGRVGDLVPVNARTRTAARRLGRREKTLAPTR